MKKRVTLSDIAKETGFSINTVSHALNNKNDISQPTKDIIRECADRLGYLGNSSASFMRSGKSKTVAIIVPDISNPHFSIIIKEMQVALSAFDYTAILFNTDEDEEAEYNAIRTSLGKNVDGIILCPVQKSKKCVNLIEKSEIPYVLVGRNFSNDKHNYVVCDNVNGGYVAAKCAITQSNGKNVLFINGQKHISSAVDRLQGVKIAFEENDAVCPCLTVYEISPMMKNDSDELSNIIKSVENLGAVICFSDLVALGVCRELSKMDISVPNDVSVIGFDDIASKFTLPMPLSSVTSSKTLMSTRTVELLMELIEGKDTGNCRIVLPTKLVLRETTKNI